MRCPGQDTRYWIPSDIFEIPCKKCGYEVEFFKDDIVRNCENCGQRMLNPRKDLGCAESCSFSEKCAQEKVKENK